jgi:hypothetical protein
MRNTQKDKSSRLHLYRASFILLSVLSSSSIGRFIIATSGNVADNGLRVMYLIPATALAIALATLSAALAAFAGTLSAALAAFAGILST